MTSTSRGTTRYLMEYDNQKSQEWLRRRKLRLAQVRKQSNEIARSLRQKIMNDEKLRLDKYDRMSEANFRDWKAEKMHELDWKLKCALYEFGDGYKQAEAEPDPDVIREEINKINYVNAQRRGEIAQQEAQRMKKRTEERKMSPINRKKLTRKKEDLRSALVRCVTVKQNACGDKNVEEVPHPEKNPTSRGATEKHTPEKAPVSRVTAEKHTLEKAPLSKAATEKNTPDKVPASRVATERHPPEKAPVSRGAKKVGKQSKDSNHPNVKKKSGKVKKKKGAGQKSCLCKNKSASSESFPRNNETVWINLNEIQSSSTGELGLRPSCSESLLSYNKNHRSRPEGTVEFYDFTSRFHCRTYREFPHLVERMDSELIEPNANELAEMENEHAEEEAKKREETEMLIQDRGMEALRREKINRDYNNLVSKLEELHKKEKVLKTQQKNQQPSFLHMSEERLSSKLKARQRLMDSKFEKLFYDATTEPPVRDSSSVEMSPRQGGGDWADVEDEGQMPLSLSPSNFKPNTPVKIDDDTSLKSSRNGGSRREKKRKKKRLLEDIEKTLQEGRELRRTVSRNQEPSEDEVEESQRENLSSDSEKEEAPICEEKPQPTTRSQECQTENIKTEGNVEETDVSLPVTTSTCYKSPPSVLRSYRVQKFLDYLEGISEPEDSDLADEKQTLKKKIDKLMYDLLRSSDSNKSVEEDEEKTEEKTEKSDENVTLQYYVAKLLTMSRERIADLSVSSLNVSTPNVTDVDLKETRCNHRFSSVEEVIRQSRLKRADSWEETIKNWKRVLEKESEKDTNPEPEDVPDCARPEAHEPETHDHEPEKTQDNPPEEPLSVFTPKMSKYEEMTKKCSERILELSQMLDKVRKDKEKLLSSTSGTSSLSLNKDGKDSVKDFEEDETCELLKCLIKKNNFDATDEKSSMMIVADFQSKDPEETFESWPDVMEELLKKNILTSPFKWSDGEPSSDFTTTVDNLQPSSIETVIGNFRKEISKIKPFTLSGDPIAQWCSTAISSPPPRCNAVLAEGVHGTRELCREWSLGDGWRPPRVNSQRIPRSMTLNSGLAIRFEARGESHSPQKPRRGSSEDSYHGLSSSPRKRIFSRHSPRGRRFHEETSVESINQALTSLGLNWAKSFLRKNEESKAINSSSNSEGKSSDSEEDLYP